LNLSEFIKKDKHKWRLQFLGEIKASSTEHSRHSCTDWMTVGQRKQKRTTDVLSLWFIAKRRRGKKLVRRSSRIISV